VAIRTSAVDEMNIPTFTAASSFCLTSRQYSVRQTAMLAEAAKSGLPQLILCRPRRPFENAADGIFISL
jgi:hypothetical protein